MILNERLQKNAPREHMLSRRVFFALLIKGRIHEVDVLLVQAVLGETQSFTEALEVDDLTGTQELDGVVDIRVVAQTEDVVVRDARLLLWYDCVRTTYHQKTIGQAISKT